MRLEFHPLARSDVSRIMDYYEDAGGPEIADEFYSELWSFLHKAVSSPEGYAIRERDIRRVNLDRFPFHFFLSYRWRARSYFGSPPPSQATFTWHPSSLALIRGS